jgi:hypothetical protein
MSTCRYFNSPKGCWNNPCRFVHSSPPQTDGSNPGASSSARPAATPSQLTSPPGTCRWYYNFGDCKLAEQCRFRHVEPRTSVPNERFGLVSPFFGYSAMASPAEQTTMSPSDALRRLATYCAPRFSFTKPTQMVPFVKILISAEPKKGKWVSLVLAPLTP